MYKFGTTRRVLTRKVLNLKIGLRVVLTARRRQRAWRALVRLGEDTIGLKIR